MLNFGIQVCLSLSLVTLLNEIFCSISAGQEKFDNIHHSYFHQAHACIMVSMSLYPLSKKTVDYYFE